MLLGAINAIAAGRRPTGITAVAARATVRAAAVTTGAAIAAVTTGAVDRIPADAGAATGAAVAALTLICVTTGAARGPLPYPKSSR
jgi:hypothetical protein